MSKLNAEQRRILKPVLSGLGKTEKNALTSAVTAASEASGSLFMAEAMMGMKQREKRAWTLAIVSILFGAAGLGLGIYGIANTKTEAYLALVDRDTGIVERAVSVERASVEQQQAVVESLIYGYVLDRETFDLDDNEYRILSVFQRSAPNVRQPLQQQWTQGSPNYPPELYGLDGIVNITITNIVMIDEDTAQVRFRKEFTSPNSPTQIGDFVATVTYRFNPSTVDNNLLLWQNPYGFQVVGYRVASEGTVE